MIAVPAISSADGSGTAVVSTCEIPYMRRSKKLGTVTPSTQRLFVLLELPMVDPRKSPSGSLDATPDVFVPVYTAKC